MAKIQKHAEFMDTLHSMITKQATAGTATGVPGKDTHYQSVSKETEHVDKNKEGKPEHNPQEFKQEKATDHSDPTKAGHGHKKSLAFQSSSFRINKKRRWVNGEKISRNSLGFSIIVFVRMRLNYGC